MNAVQLPCIDLLPVKVTIDADVPEQSYERDNMLYSQITFLFVGQGVLVFHFGSLHHCPLCTAEHHLKTGTHFVTTHRKSLSRHTAATAHQQGRSACYGGLEKTPGACQDIKSLSMTPCYHRLTKGEKAAKPNNKHNIQHTATKTRN
jgi:hypothetical protein